MSQTVGPDMSKFRPFGKVLSLLHFNEGLFSIGQQFVSTLANFECY